MKIYSLTTLIVLLFLSDPPTLFSQDSPVSLKDKLYNQTSIAFGSNRDGNSEVYIMNSDGSNQTRLTDNLAFDHFPSWSPDGKKIAFASERDGDGNMNIYIMNADGSDLINLTNDPAYEGYPNWSPFLKAQTEPSIHDLIQLQADKIFDTLVNIRRDIHENPELSFNEIRTSKLLAEYLSSLGLEVKTNVGGYGVVGILQCKNKGKIIGWRAEMDAYKTDLPDVVDFKSKVDSIRHICGHDVHTTIGLGIANVLSKLRDSISGTVVFIFQPAEEYCEGAKHMIDDGLYDIIKPDEIYCLHLDDIPAGKVAIKANAFFAYLKPLNITYKNIEDKDLVISFTKSVLNKYSTLDCNLWDKSLDHKIGIFSGNSIFKDFVSFCGEIFLQENGQVITLRTYYYGTDKKQLDSLPE